MKLSAAPGGVTAAGGSGVALVAQCHGQFLCLRDILTLESEGAGPILTPPEMRGLKHTYVQG